MKKKLIIIIPSVIIGLVIIVLVFAKLNNISPLSWKSHDPVFSEKGVAIKGYDPVAYFVDGNAKQGLEQYTCNWNEAKWRFSSEKNLTLFRANPEQYAPQFGGYCPFAVSKGFTAEVDPGYWTISENKLYVFSNADVLIDWKKEEESLSEAASNNWSVRK